MATLRAEGGVAPPSSEAPVSTLWASLGPRQLVELALPGALIGLLGGAVAGAMAALGGLPLGETLVAGIALALPLALAGAGYELLLAAGRIPLGPLTPIALYWAVAFPVARVIHATVVSLTAGDPVAVPYGWLDFVVYQMLLSVGFAIGFWWLHQTFAPGWWYHLRDRNPVASYFIRRQLRYVGAMHEERQQRRQGRRARRANRRSRRRKR